MLFLSRALLSLCYGGKPVCRKAFESLLGVGSSRIDRLRSTHGGLDLRRIGTDCDGMCMLHYTYDNVHILYAQCAMAERMRCTNEYFDPCVHACGVRVCANAVVAQATLVDACHHGAGGNYSQTTGPSAHAFLEELYYSVGETMPHASSD